MDYAQEARKTPACNLSQFAVGSATYQLFGEGTARKALPAAKGGAIAEIVPVTNILKAIEASKSGKTAPIEGYLLATITKNDFTGWRFYTGMPTASVLMHDMAEALESNGSFIFRNGADGKTSIAVPKG